MPALVKRAAAFWRHRFLRTPVLARHGDWSEYYRTAEAYAEAQWLLIEGFLREPIIPDFSVVLDFACGQGRIAERFAAISGKVICADTSPEAIEACRKRFAGHANIECLVSGARIPVASESITFLYSWDAMVHFSIGELEEYFREFQRVLRPGGTGFIHHSNYAAVSNQERGWQANPGSRAFVSAENVRRICEKQGLTVTKQQVIDWSQADLDCITLLKKPK